MNGLKISTAVILMFGFYGHAQEEVQKEKIIKKEIKKEVQVESKNGETTLTITTEENGVVKKKVYRGEEAELKLTEMNGETGGKEEMKETKEIKIEEVDGEKKLTIITTKNDNVNEEVFVGEEVDKKLKELGLDEKKTEEKVYIKKKQKTLKTVSE